MSHVLPFRMSHFSAAGPLLKCEDQLCTFELLTKVSRVLQCDYLPREYLIFKALKE